MLNYVWLTLIVAGVLTATGRDIYDSVTNTYGNNIPWTMELREPGALQESGVSQPTVRILPSDIRRHFVHASVKADTLTVASRVTMHSQAEGVIVLTVTEEHPAIFTTIAESQGTKGLITGRLLRGTANADQAVTVTFAPVQFVYLKKVTAAAFDAAGLAVQIAIGLIGIMALWLGIMKIAEEAGLIARIATLVKPITVRLFPDIPPDHPAVGSILMNISANMLGLGNAATPFGLKAMEQLNEINPNAGTASNAMCTFLAMNTSCITLIPATAIAIRASMGSANPAVIIGTTFLASLTATTVALITAKFLERTKLYRLKPKEGV